MKKKLPKFKLTPEAMKIIAAHVKSLPMFQRRNDKGELMFKPMSIKSSRTPVKTPVLVNHDVNLRSIYEQEGEAGMNYYVKFFMDLHEQNMSEIEAKKKEAKIISLKK